MEKQLQAAFDRLANSINDIPLSAANRERLSRDANDVAAVAQEMMKRVRELEAEKAEPEGD